MERIGHPRVIVGIDDSLTGLAALRTAVAEARRRGLPLHALRVRTSGIPCIDSNLIDATFVTALGGRPADLEIHAEVADDTIRGAICEAAKHPGDLIVVGNSGGGMLHALWFGSVSRSCLRGARCAVLAVPAPDLARTAHRKHRWRPRRRDLWAEFEHETPALH
jgi:nucleotide-binding universal stress UspA family protein